MKLLWKCEGCDWSSEATGAGSAAAMRHLKEVKARGETHSIVLMNTETGEIMSDSEGHPIKSLAKAQNLGLIPRIGKKGGIGDLIKSTGLKGKIAPEEVVLDPRMKFFYEWDRIMVPEYDGSFSDWLWECVLGFHIQNRERLKFNLLAEEVVK